MVAGDVDDGFPVFEADADAQELVDAPLAGSVEGGVEVAVVGGQVDAV